MKKKWSVKWKASRQPRKQRKYVYNAPLHVKRKLISAHLSEELRKRFGKRSIPVRKGDEVVVMVGTQKKTRGSVEKVDVGNGKVYVQGIKSKKVDGSEVPRPLRASNIMIVKLNLDDKRRQAVFERAGAARKAAPSEKTKTKEEGGS